MQQFPADRVISIHGTRRKLLFCLLKGDEQSIGFYFREVKRAHTGLPCRLKGCLSKRRLDLFDAILGVQFKRTGKGQFGNLSADLGIIL